MRIGFVTTLASNTWGGSEELWHRAAMQALEQKHQVAASIYQINAPHERIAQLQQNQAHILTRRTITSRRLRMLYEKIVNPHISLNRFQPDVLCISEAAAFDTARNFGAKGISRLTQGGQIPYVVVVQYNDDLHLLSDAMRHAARAFYRNAQKVCFVSRHNRQAAERQLATRLDNATVVCNPFNIESLEPVAWPDIADKAPATLCNMARLEALYKGQDVLLQVLGEPQWAQTPIRLDICGSGKDQAYFEELIQLYGLTDRVKLLGHQNDLRKVWAEHEMLILSSRGEGTPLAMIEAMSCGRPAIVTDVGGNADWVVEGESGFIAEAPTPRSLGAAMRRAIQQRHRWRQMGQAAHEHAMQRIDKTPGQTLLNIIIQAHQPSSRQS